MNRSLFAVLFALACCTAQAETLECGGATGEISFVKAPKNEVDYVLTVRRDGRTVRTQHSADDFTSLTCQRTALGRFLLVSYALCSGSHCFHQKAIVDPLTLQILVEATGTNTFSSVSFDKARAILGATPTLVGKEIFIKRETALARTYPVTQRDINAAIALYEQGKVEKAIELFQDFAERGSTEAKNQLGSMPRSELSNTEYWCALAEEQGPAKCRDIRNSYNHSDEQRAKANAEEPKRLEIGMTKFRVESIYGRPTRIRASTTANTESDVEAWYYEKRNAILLFDYRGHLSMIQE